MKHKLNFIDSELSKIKNDNLHRKLQYGKAQGAYITIKEKKLINLCSNDYLGIPITKIQTNQLQSSSRLVSGNDESYRKLEKIVASGGKFDPRLKKQCSNHENPYSETNRR